MDTQKISTSECSFTDRVENLYLNPKVSRQEKETVHQHIKTCLVCRKKFAGLGLLYSQVYKELQKPVSNKVLDLAKRINHSDTNIGLVVCEPLTRKHQETRFRTKLVFTANGKSGKNFQDFDFSTLPDRSIAIRAMIDKKHDKVLLYLWARNNNGFERYTLSFPEPIKNLEFSSSGVSESHFINIEDFDNKVIHLEKQKATVSNKKKKSLLYNFSNN